MPNVTDREKEEGDLAAAAQRGDRIAFGRLLELHYDRIYRIAYRTLGSASDAEDVAQAVCLALVTKIASFGGRSRFSTWLTSIVINACRDFLRRRKSTQALVARYGAMRELEAGEQADAAWREDWLDEALSALEAPLRETVVLVIGEELSHADAAAILGCAESTVSWRMHNVKKRLRTHLDNDHDR